MFEFDGIKHLFSGEYRYGTGSFARVALDPDGISAVLGLIIGTQMIGGGSFFWIIITWPLCFLFIRGFLWLIWKMISFPFKLFDKIRERVTTDHGNDVKMDNTENTNNKIQGNTCPRCGRQLRRLNGKFGPFWGCSGYKTTDPCRYTRNINK